MPYTGDELEQKLLELIVQRKYAPDGKFLSDRDAMALFNASRSAVRRAINELVKQGYLYRKQGKGTYVHSKAGEYPIFSVIDPIPMLDREGYETDRRVVVKETMPSTKLMADKLRINAGDQVLRLGILITADRVPVNYTIVHIPLEKFTKMENADYAKATVEAVYASCYDVKLKYWQHCVQAVLAPPDVAGALQIAPDDPVLVFDSVGWGTFGSADCPLEYAYFYCKPEFARFTYIQKVGGDAR